MAGYAKSGSGVDLVHLWVSAVLTVASAAMLILFFPGAAFLAAALLAAFLLSAGTGLVVDTATG